jgi:hypothetical protein
MRESKRKGHLRIPFRLQVVYGSRRFFSGFAIVMAIFFLYGPIPARLADHNGYRYLLGPFLCPLLGLSVHLLFPYNPYRTWRASDRSLHRLDERDEKARRLVEIFRSPECRGVTVRAAVTLSLVLFGIMGTFALVFRGSLTWSLTSSWLFQGLGMGALFAWIFLRVRSAAWALDTWWMESGEPSSPQGQGLGSV